jgi:hypothetical protein
MVREVQKDTRVSAEGLKVDKRPTGNKRGPAGDKK